MGKSYTIKNTKEFQSYNKEGVVCLKQREITGSTLKMIAIVSMLIDHIGASVVQLMLQERGLLSFAALGMETIRQLEGADRNLALLWWVMRMVIGRIAFPIFCYLLVEGFLHTRNVWKYAGRLFLFSLISEIPFDLCIFQTWCTWERQNVFFTLFIGILCMQGIACLEQWEKEEKNQKNKYIFCAANVLKILVLTAGMVCAQLFRTDYGAMGVAFILCLFLFRKQRILQLTAGCVGSLLLLQEVTAPLAFCFIAWYKGKRGSSHKYFFYIIYPLHLFLLYWICVFLKLVKTA